MKKEYRVCIVDLYNRVQLMNKSFPTIKKAEEYITKLPIGRYTILPLYTSNNEL